jgi:CO dehydrogenase nickel-insertion accessory protein CooC1
MTRTYAAVINKGGAGKTTLVTLLGGEYALRGERVLLIDADNRQNPSIEWKRNAAEMGKAAVACSEASDLTVLGCSGCNEESEATKIQAHTEKWITARPLPSAAESW